ncbi:MAG: glutamine--tRNA ligase [Planctomycetota bacterium]|nr:MAG: glutamine--tRNA ligase [Planctomycetota bacterium]
MDNTPSDASTGASNFIREKIDADLASGKHSKVVTRFPPEPNGWLHIGHAKSICLNFGIAKDYDGDCHLRFDDTNPATEEASYVEAIQRDVRWLGWEWAGEVRYASDYFEAMYAYAESLIKAGKAYVDSASLEEVREARGTVYAPGRATPDRERLPAESLDLFRRMRAGEFPDGAYVLRAKIDMSSTNMLLRDPLLYRIRHAHHYRTGDTWCLYPMYDFAHCLEDSIEHVTHSLCTLEFDNNRAVYDWVLDSGDPPSRPEQTEFARLALGYTVVSKRTLLRLVNEGHVSGWDDPRMPTLAGLRRRGVRPEAIRAFCERVGVAKNNTLVDLELLDHSIRDDLNTEAPRVMAVLRPLKLVLTDWPDGKVDMLDAPLWPEDVGKAGSRALPFSGELYIERDDFAEEPVKGWHRLAPGVEVRLRYGYLITCTEVIKDANGEVVELRGTHDPKSRGGDAPDGRRVKGTLHWVSAAQSLPAEVRLYDRLFAVERPGQIEGVDMLDELNPNSLEVCEGARVEPSLATTKPGERVQFERQGYFAADDDSAAGALVFNRIVGLRDSWAKIAAGGGGNAKAGGKSGDANAQGAGGTHTAGDAARTKSERMAKGTTPEVAASHARDELRAADDELAARHARYANELDLSPTDADLLSGDRALSDFFDAACTAADATPASVARWLLNELPRHASGREHAELPFDAKTFGRFVALVDTGVLTAVGAKKVLAVLASKGGEPAELVDSLGLAAQSDTGALQASIDDVLAAHPDELARFRAGDAKLMGFFMGALMRATGGKADPGKAGELLRASLRG